MNDFSLLVDGAFSSSGFDPARRDPARRLPGRDVQGVCLVDFFQSQAAGFDQAVEENSQHRATQASDFVYLQEVDVDTTASKNTGEDQQDQRSDVGCDL